MPTALQAGHHHHGEGKGAERHPRTLPGPKSHLGSVHESPSIEQPEPMLMAVAEAGLVGDPVGATVLILRCTEGLAEATQRPPPLCCIPRRLPPKDPKPPERWLKGQNLDVTLSAPKELYSEAPRSVLGGTIDKKGGAGTMGRYGASRVVVKVT